MKTHIRPVIVALFTLVGCGAGDAADEAPQATAASLNGSSTFGRTATGSPITASADYKRASKFSLPDPNATVTKLTAYLDGLGATSGSQTVRGVVYADVGGAPAGRLCVTTDVVVQAGAAATWVDLPVSGSCPLAASGVYWLALHTSGAAGVARYYGGAVTGALRHNGDTFSDGASNPFGSNPSAADVELSVYATYLTSGVFGKTTPGSVATTASGDYKRASKFDLSTSNATIDKLSAYLDGLGATTGSQTVRGLVYADSGGAPGARLCASSALTIGANAPAAWIDFALSGCTLTAGSYWLALQTGPTEGVARYYADAAASALRHNGDSFSDGASNPFGAAGSGDLRLSIYATYTAGGGAPPPAPTGNYYVATTGSDSNPGTQAAPFRHVSKAAAVAHAGDVVVVLDGTYDNEGVVGPGYVVTLHTSGTATQPITFIAQHRGQAVLDSMNTTIGSSCNGASAYFNLLNASYIVIDGFVIQRGCDEGIHSNDAAHHITLRHNEIRNIANRTITDSYGRDGMYTNPSCHDFTIDANVFHHIGRTNQVNYDHGLYLHGTNFSVTNNVFYAIPNGWSIQLADGLSNISIAHNTFAFTDDYQGGQIMLWDTQSGLTIRNNIFFGALNVAIKRYTSTVNGCNIDHNMVTGATAVIDDPTGCTLASNSIGVDPKFVNGTSMPYDFHLQAGSPAIDTGVAIGAVSTDFDGDARPRGAGYDLGADEYGP